MNRLSQLLRGGSRADRELSFDEWLGSFSFNGLGYPISMVNQTSPGGKTQEIQPTLTGLANGALRGNGIVRACVMARMLLFSEATFQYRPLGSITSGDLYGKPTLELLETPWPGGTTRSLLSLIDLYAQLAGNAYVVRDPLNAGTLRVLRPDWITIVLGARNAPSDFETWDVETEIIGYAYKPFNDTARAQGFLPDQVAHFMPEPNPDFPFKGTSWLQPVVREVMADNGMTEHKLKFLENGATPNMIVTLDPSVRKEEFNTWVDLFDAGHKGVMNAYKTIFLAGGADAKVVGSNLSELDFRSVQAHGETRVCNAAGIPPILVGISEGLDSATYSNYGQAKRAWGDMRLRPLWGDVCSKLGPLVGPPAGSELWYDERRIAFLAEDVKDQAEILQTNAATLKSLIDGGWTPESAQTYLETGDLSKLTHTGLYSIQLQPPGTSFPNATTVAPTGPPATPDTPAAPAAPVAPAAMLCSLCRSPAASNHARCPKCRELSAALAVKPVETIAALSEQLGVDIFSVEVALGRRTLPPPPFKVTGSKRDLLTPTRDQIRRAVVGASSNGNGSGRL